MRNGTALELQTAIKCDNFGDKNFRTPSEHFATAVRLSTTGNDESNQPVLPNFLNALTTCQHVITSPDFDDPSNIGLLMSTVLRLNAAQTPHQVLRTLERFDGHLHTNRHMLSCTVHLVMPQKVRGKRSKVVQVHEISDAINPLLDIVILCFDLTGVSARLPKHYPADPDTFCELPLNYFLTGYGSNGFIGDTFRFMQRCTGGMMTCLRVAELTASDYPQLLLELKRGRKDFHGTDTTVEEKYEEFSTLSKSLRNSNHLRSLYKSHLVASAQPYRLLAHAHNFTFHAVSFISSSSCSRGFITSQIGIHSYDAIEPRSSDYLLALSEFDVISARALYTWSLDYQSPFALPSVLCPFGITGWLILLSLIGMTIIITAFKVRAIGKLMLEVILLKISPLIGQTFDTKLMHKVKIWYVFWLLVVFFVSAVYGNVLQSLVVVPDTKDANAPILSLINEGYEAYASAAVLDALEPLETMRALVINGTASKKVLADAEVLSHLKPKDLNNPVEIRDFFMTKSILFVSEDNSAIYKQLVPSLTWRDLRISVERFFTVPTWWYFGYAVNSDVLMDTLRILRQAGLLELWYKITLDRFARAFAKPYARMAKEMKLLDDHMGTLTPETTSLSDSLILECFAICGYGLSIALISHIAQIHLRRFGQDRRA